MSSSIRSVLIPLLSLIVLILPQAFAGDWTPEDFELISGPASPRVALGLRRAGDSLEAALDIDALDGNGAQKIELGLAAARKLMLTEKDARAGRGAENDVARYLFTIPSGALAGVEGDWQKLRAGVAVAWGGGALGLDRQRERFRHNSGATHAGLSPNETDWMPFNLAENMLAVENRKNRIWIGFDQPMDGKATLVIEDEAGKRVRNLIAGVPLAKGSQRIEWDGLDEKGNVAGPGKYSWRSIHHPGIKPEYIMSYGNGDNQEKDLGGWGPNHVILIAATAGLEWTFLGAPFTEGGDAIVAVDQQGTKRMGYNPVMGTGLGRVELTTEGGVLYVANDGLAWGQRLDTSKPNAKTQQKITLSRFEIKTGNILDFKGKGRFAPVWSVEVGPDANEKDKDGKALSLKPEDAPTSMTGMAALNGKLFISNIRTQSLLVVDANSGEKISELKLDAPGPLTVSKGELYAVSGTRIVKIDPVSGETKEIVPPGQTIARGITVDGTGNIYVSDADTHTIKVFDPAGKLLKEIGKRGGEYAGTFDPERMVRPCGIAIAANGWLWVAENREYPKRVLAWDLATGKVAVEKFGTPHYGGPGAGFDGADLTRWTGSGATWKMDLEKKSAEIKSVLGSHFTPTHYTFVHQDGRTFVIGYQGFTSISELKEDGSLKDLAFIGSTHRYCYACEWRPPAAFVEAFNNAFPKMKGKHSEKGPGVLWVDKNGDGEIQADEFEFSSDAENFAGASWGHLFHDLTMTVPALVKGKRVLVTLKPDGYYPGGAPKYPPLNPACAAGVPVDLQTNEVESAVDRFGDVIFNTDPEMKCFSPQGKLLWSYPNRWSNVHGSHDAPLPELGVMQGALFFLGMVPLDDKADVFVMNGNHGRFFVLTSDGLYLDEMFKDVRMGGKRDPYLIGGEAFGGFFGKAEKTGEYYLEAGSYRVFHLSGLTQAKRNAGTLQVTAQQSIAAERNLANKVARKSAKKDANVTRLKTEPVIDGKDSDWAGVPMVKWDKSGRFPAGVRAGYDDRNLYLFYDIGDSSHWKNSGKDWTLLFKTGDSVDLQLATDPSANSSRTQPVPGDIRVLIAPYQGKNVAVLYRHRLPVKDNPVTFTCPWRSENVDSVKLLTDARIAVRNENRHSFVEAAIPLSDLGLKIDDGKPLSLKADFGVIYGDDDGTLNMLRSYWSNQNTGLVSDVPGEIMLSPNLWGTVTFEGAAK